MYWFCHTSTRVHPWQIHVDVICHFKIKHFIILITSTIFKIFNSRFLHFSNSYKEQKHIVVFAFSFIITAEGMFVWKECSYLLIIIYVFLIGINLAAFIIIVFSYGSMFYSIHQSAITANEIRNQVKKEMILAKRFFFIVFTDALCWIPIFILKFLSLLQVEIPGTNFFFL